MAFLDSFDISGYGLSAQRVRVNVISSNIANAQTTRTDEGWTVPSSRSRIQSD